MSDSEPVQAVGTRYNDGRYLETNCDWHASDAPWKAALIARMLNRHSVQPKTIAEVGCGSGEILVTLADQFCGAKFTGFELSSDAFAICKPKERKGLAFRLQDVSKSGEHFDVLMVIDVFEHVENYFDFLRKLRGAADYFVFHIPLEIHASALLGNGFARARERAGHLHYFTAETALATLRDAGYHVADSEFTPAFAAVGTGRASFKERLAYQPRRLLFALSPNLLSKSLGGCSLLVLAR